MEYRLFKDTKQGLIWIENDEGEVKLCLTIAEWTYLISHPVVNQPDEEPLIA